MKNRSIQAIVASVLLVLGKNSLCAQPQPKLYGILRPDEVSRQLVLHSGDRLYDLKCQNLSSTVEMIKSLGFSPTSPVIEIDSEINITVGTDVIKDREGLKKKIEENKPLYCRDYVSGEPLDKNEYLIGTWPVNNKVRTFMVYQKGVNVTLLDITGCRDIRRGVAMKLPGVALAPIDSEVSPISQQQYDRGKPGIPFYCQNGKPFFQPSANVFAAPVTAHEMVAGSTLDVKVETAAGFDPSILDANSIYLRRKTCSWLRFNANSLKISGDSYVSTVPYSCEVEIGARLRDKSDVQTTTVRIDVQPIKIKSLTVGYRRNCAILNNGKVSCWGAADKVTSADGFSKAIEWLDNSLFVALPTSPFAQFQGIYHIQHPLDPMSEVIGEANPAPQFLKHLALFQDSKMQSDMIWDEIIDLQAGLEGACMRTQNDSAGETIQCFGPRLDWYDLPSEPVSAGKSQLGTDGLCLATANNRVVCDRVGTTHMSAMAQPKTFGVGLGASCAIKQDRTIECLSDDSSHPLLAHPKASDPARFERLSVGPDFACAIQSAGQVMCWGNNTMGQIPVGISMIPADEIQVGYDHACVLGRNRQTVFCWGGKTFTNDLPGASAGVVRKADVNLMLESLKGWEVLD